MPSNRQGFAAQPRGCLLWVISRHFAVQSPCPLYPRKRTCVVQLGMSALGQKRTCYPPSSVGISLLQKNARRSGRTHSVIVAANPDAAWSPRGRYPTPAVVTVSGGEDW